METWEALLTVLAIFNHQEFSLQPLKVEINLLQILERQGSDFSVLEERSGPSWVSRSPVSGHGKQFEFNLDSQVGIAEGLVILVFC